MKSRRYKNVYIPILVILQSSLLFLITITEAMEVYLETQKTIGKKWNVLIASFIPKGIGLPKLNLHEIIQYDLEFSGYFNVSTIEKVPVISPEITSTDPINIDWRFLSDSGVENLILGEYEVKDNKLIVKCYLYEVSRKIRLLGKQYVGELSTQREIAHSFSDEIVYTITGKQGIAKSKITFVCKSTGNKEIYIMDYDGYNVSQVTFDKSINLSPCWLPDTSGIVYVSFKGGNPDIYLLDLKTRKSNVIYSHPGTDGAPCVSPSGKFVVASLTKDGNPEIYLLPLQGKGAIRRLTFDAEIDTEPVWAPTEREIAFVSNRSGSPQIYVMDVEGANVRRITYEGNYNVSPAWSPLGDQLAYVGRTAEGFNIFLIGIDGTNLRQITTGPGDNENPSWSPDGRHIVFSSTRSGESQIYAMNVEGRIYKLTSLKGGCFEPNWSK